MATSTKTVTITDLIAQHADDIAFVAEEQPATTISDFVNQLRMATDTLANYADINGSEDLEAAATYLSDAENSTDDTERTVLLNRARALLTNTTDIVNDYRLMV